MTGTRVIRTARWQPCCRLRRLHTPSQPSAPQKPDGQVVAAASKTPAKMQELRAELEALRLPALVRRAQEAGVNERQLDDASEGDTPKQSITRLIIAAIQPKPIQVREKCLHGRRKTLCKECGGSGLCPHGGHRGLTVHMRTDLRKDILWHGPHCRDSSTERRHASTHAHTDICLHARLCTCPHYSGRQKCACKDCGGSQMCGHGRRRALSAVD